MKALRVVALLVLVAAAGTMASACGGDGKTEASVSAWSDMAATFKPGVDPASANACTRGDRGCLDLVRGEMQRRLKPLADSCDHDALFATMYLRMTERIIDAYDEGRFKDPAATSHITAWFATYYFRAYDDWHGGRPAAVPDAWRQAFEAADDRTVRALGDLLLGMNAHVSRDLPFVVEDVLPGAQPVIDPDYALVNTLIADLSPGVLRELADQYDPSLFAAAVPLGLGGATSVGELVTLWRTQSWERGNAIKAAKPADRGALVAEVEEDARSRAEAASTELRLVPGLERTAQRDAYCKGRKYAARAGHGCYAVYPRACATTA